MTTETDLVSPTLANTMQTAVESALCNVHTSMPGKIISYDKDKQLAVVQPMIKRRYKDGREVSLPQIQNVPVMFPYSGDDLKIYFKINAGDSVLLIFSERSIDKWLEDGQELVPGDKRKFHLSDAFAIPGFKPKSDAFTDLKGEEDSYVIENKDIYFEVNKDGKFAFKNKDHEFVSVLVDLITEMVAGKNLTAVGPLNKDPAYIAKLEEIKEKLESFKV